MNKNQLQELLEGLTISFAEVANTLVNTRRELKDKREANCSKLRHINLEPAQGPGDNDQHQNPHNGHIARNCFSERKQKRDPEERQSTNYMGWADPYDNNQEGWVEDKVYALAEKCHQPYPVNSNREKRIQAQPGGT
ncbi:7615_t:CDS:2 [Gigaspora margarita]|uniref:7615_t:CDS:1 n=1 Tax=Gigaspora margarita TaxID=4874 RepID=A0ABM8W4M7_GIGMA|nr:7615_t:CDS:2 [Gigaspora margarita]